LTERTIILHYHLFKNAGTSLDLIFQQNYRNSWVTREFPDDGGNNTPLVEEWIRSEPDAVVFSSHTMIGPIPKVEGVRIFSVIFLRDPIARILSAYRFERNQNANTLGSRLAREHDLEGYVRGQLAVPGDRQCRNFHTYRLSAFLPGPEPELRRALRALRLISFVGRVDRFDTSLARMSVGLGDSITYQSSVHANSTDSTNEIVSPEILALLEEHNADDQKLWAEFKEIFEGSAEGATQ
jgi:hypothetical protein